MKQDNKDNRNINKNKTNKNNKDKSREGKFVTLIAVKGRRKGLVVLLPEADKDDFLKKYKDFEEM